MRTFIAACMLGAILGCGADGGLMDPGTDVPPNNTLARADAQIDEPGQGWPTDPVTIDRIDVVDDWMRVHVTYGGGCQRHDFALVVSPAFMESHPVQVQAMLSHDAHGDACRAILRRILSFDLTPVRELYAASYNDPSGTIIINVAGWREPVTYSF